MGVLKRILLLVFSISAIIGVSFLVLWWSSLRAVDATLKALMGQEWFFITELVLLGIFALGVIAAILWAILSPTKSSRLVLESDPIYVGISHDVITSAARQAIETHPGMKVRDIKMKVSSRENPDMKIKAKIDPGKNTDLTNEGARLNTTIKTTVERLTGYPLKKTSIKFVKPEKPSRSKYAPAQFNQPTPQSSAQTNATDIPVSTSTTPSTN